MSDECVTRFATKKWNFDINYDGMGPSKRWRWLMACISFWTDPCRFMESEVRAGL